MTSSIIERLDTALVEDSADGLFRCDRAIFTDAGFFELEMKHLFEGNWVYLAHESQIPNKNDYFTTWMGRQPIFIARKDTSLTPSSMPAVIVAQCFAVTSAATSRHLPARFTVGHSAIPESC